MKQKYAKLQNFELIYKIYFCFLQKSITLLVVIYKLKLL